MGACSAELMLSLRVPKRSASWRSSSGGSEPARTTASAQQQHEDADVAVSQRARGASNALPRKGSGESHGKQGDAANEGGSPRHARSCWD
ncbi:unnamed protein product [Lampetra fluviatilis]